jgi:hypothetical protein
MTNRGTVVTDAAKDQETLSLTHNRMNWLGEKPSYLVEKASADDDIED